MWGLAFAGIATLIHDPEWRIEEDEAKEMSDRLAAASDSFQSDKTSKLVLWIKKHEAPLYFLTGLLMILVPRLYHTITKANRAKLVQAQTDRPAAAPVVAGPRLVVDVPNADIAPPVADVPAHPAPVVEFTGTADNGRAPAGFEARPFTRADFHDFNPSVE